MQFANYAFPLPQIVDSIDNAFQAVQNSLEMVGGTLCIMQAQKPSSANDNHINHQHAAYALNADLKFFEKLGISPEVVRQLREAGFNPEALSRGELRDADLSFSVDGRVIDDPEDTTFHGKLRKTSAETEQREENKTPDIIDPLAPPEGFVAMVKRRRRLYNDSKKPAETENKTPHEHPSFCATVEEAREKSHQQIHHHDH